MKISAPEPDPDRREHASDAVSEHGGLRLVGAVAERDRSRAVGGTRRLRAAPPVQLELVSGRESPGPEVVWASLPEQAREQVLVLLARLIDTGAVAEDEG